jgi:NAD(P)-dependent dehydrogenase (short-subunit alcohol dehydrogenase family)
MSYLNRFRLDGYCSIVTGGAQGIGKAIAKALAEAGSDIVIADVDWEKANQTVEELSEYQVDALAVPCDIRKPEDAKRVALAAVDRFGKIDVLVNNAGICRHERAEEMSYEDWFDVIQTNLTGTFLMSQAVGKEMIRRNKGSIINISSMSGMIVNTPQRQCAFNASKGGIIQLTKSLAFEWAEFGIRVNSIAPGYVKVESNSVIYEGGPHPIRKFGEDIEKTWIGLTPLRRAGVPDDFAGLAIYLASEASSFATGSVFLVDGGYSVL